MPTYTYDTVAERAIPIKLLLTGASGSGKTTLSAQFPAPLFFNFDNNLSGLQQQLKGKHIPYLSPALGPDRVPLPINKVYDNFWSMLQFVAEDPAIKTIVIDSLTTMGTALMYKVLNTTNPAAKMEIQHWGAYANYFGQFCDQLLGNPALNKHVVLIAHEQAVDTKDDTSLKLFEITVPGSYKSRFGLHCTDVWRLYTKESIKGPPEFRCRTKPNKLYDYKCSLPIPDDFAVADQLPTILSLVEARLPKA